MLSAFVQLQVEEIEVAECFLFEASLPVWNLYEDKKSGLWLLRGFFQDDAERAAGVAELQDYFSPTNPVQYEEVVDKDWQNAYKEFLSPWSYERLHWIPVWQKEEYVLPPTAVPLYYDADMAFGTGSHETTRLCGMGLYDFMRESAESFPRRKILDAGCGSGILAISALLLGAREIAAFDIDPDTMRVCAENLERNERREEEVHFFVADLESGLPCDQSVDLLLANIQTHILVPSLKEFIQSVAAKGRIVFSGILTEEESKFTKALTETCRLMQAPEAFSVQKMGEWISVTWVNE